MPPRAAAEGVGGYGATSFRAARIALNIVAYVLISRVKKIPSESCMSDVKYCAFDVDRLRVTTG